MQFTVPVLIHDMPALEYYKALYPKHFYAKLVHKIATKVHWRTMLSEAQNHRCCWCGIKVTELRDRPDSATIEHVVPKSQGGADHPDNFAIACHSCNGRRGVKSVEDFMLQEQSANDKASLRRELMNKFGTKSSNNTGRARLNRRLDLNQARAAVLAGMPNTFEPGSRAYNAYLRYSALPRESLSGTRNIGGDTKISAQSPVDAPAADATVAHGEMRSTQMQHTVETIRELLATNDRAVGRALVVLRNRQTSDEQVSETTKHQNGRGFRPAHARMGTSMANFFEARGYLTAKQANYWRAAMADGKSRIGIYARQLLEEVEAKQRAKAAIEDVGNHEEAMMAEREMQQMEAKHDREQSRLEEIRKHLAREIMETAA